MGKKAVILVDMLNDFVTGALTCDRAKAIVPQLEKLVKAAREKGVYVIYANDAHIKGVDRELQLWGDHAIIGTGGAEVIPELTPQEGDFVVPKRRYSGFFQTDLHLSLIHILFFRVIDPTVRNRQGNDFGTQYRTGIYYISAADEAEIRRYVAGLRQKYARPVVTEVEKLRNYYTAEPYHQNYLEKHPEGYCHIGKEAFQYAGTYTPLQTAR